MQDKQPYEFFYECEVSLLDSPLWLQHPIRNLTIHKEVIGHLPLGGLSHICLTLEPTILDQLSPIVKLGDEGGPCGINVRAIEKHTNNWRRSIYPFASDQDVHKRCMFGCIGPPVQLRIESFHIGGLQITHHFFDIAANIPSNPLQPMFGEYSMDGRHSAITPSEKPPLQCQGPGHYPLVVGHLGITIYFILTLNTPPVGFISNRSKDGSLLCLSRISTISLIKQRQTGPK